MIQQFTPTIFFNHCFDKRRFQHFLHWFFQKSRQGQCRTLHFLEKLKSLGFESATEAGFSISIEDLKIPSSKSPLLLTTENLVGEGDLQFSLGCLTKIERFQQILEIWNRTSEKLKLQVLGSFQMSDFLNPVYLMAFSGARGNISQIRQLVGMRGLMADPQGQIVDFPIRSNFREGLTLTEYLISCSGARKGIVDTALRTAASGYLTRRLVDVAHHVIIHQIDCRTTSGIFLEDLYDQQKKILCLQERLVGRVLAETIYIPLQKIESQSHFSSLQCSEDRKIGFKNQEISKALSQQICQYRSRVVIRSPLTCQSSQFICQLCYGWNLAEGQCVSIGEAVGVLAAQSIGEPGTQLTMRTFHTGGVFTGRLIHQTYASFQGKMHYPTMCSGLLVRTQQGKIAFLTKNQGIFQILQLPGITDISHHFPYRLEPLLWRKNRKRSFQKKTNIPIRFTQPSIDGNGLIFSKKKCLPEYSNFENQLQKLNFQLQSMQLIGHSLSSTSYFNLSTTDYGLPIFSYSQTSEKLKKQMIVSFKASTLLYTRQGEIVEKQQLIAENPSFEGNEFFENEQDILSPIAGEIYFENFVFLEKTIVDLKNDISFRQITQNFVQGLGEFWILFGQVFQIYHFSKNLSFFRKYDLMDRKVAFSQIRLEPKYSPQFSLGLENLPRAIFFRTKDSKYSLPQASWIFFKKRGYLQIPHIIGQQSKAMFSDQQNVRTWTTGLHFPSKSLDLSIQSSWKTSSKKLVTYFPLYIKNFKLYFHKNEVQILNLSMMENKSRALNRQKLCYSHTSILDQKIHIFVELQKYIRFSDIDQIVFFHENFCSLSMNRQGLCQLIGQTVFFHEISLSDRIRLSTFRPTFPKLHLLRNLRNVDHFEAGLLSKNNLPKNRPMKNSLSNLLFDKQSLHLQNKDIFQSLQTSPQILSRKALKSFTKNYHKDLDIKHHKRTLDLTSSTMLSIMRFLFRKKCHFFLNFPEDLIRRQVQSKPIIFHWSNLPNQKYFVFLNFLKKLKIQKVEADDISTSHQLSFQTKFQNSNFLDSSVDFVDQKMKPNLQRGIDQLQYPQVQRWVFQQRTIDLFSESFQFDISTIFLNRLGRSAFLRIFLFCDLLSVDTLQSFEYPDKVAKIKIKNQKHIEQKILTLRPTEEFQKFFLRSLDSIKSQDNIIHQKIHGESRALLSLQINDIVKGHLSLKSIEKLLFNRQNSCQLSPRIYPKKETMFQSQILFQNQFKKIYFKFDYLNWMKQLRPQSRLTCASDFQWNFWGYWTFQAQNPKHYPTYFRNFRTAVHNIFPSWNDGRSKTIVSLVNNWFESPTNPQTQSEFSNFATDQLQIQNGASLNLISSSSLKTSSFQSLGLNSQILSSRWFCQKIFPRSLLSNSGSRIESGLQIPKKILDFYYHSFFFLLKNFYLIKNFQKRFDQSVPQEPIYYFNDLHSARNIYFSEEMKNDQQAFFQKIFLNKHFKFKKSETSNQLTCMLLETLDKRENYARDESSSRNENQNLLFKIFEFTAQQIQKQEQVSKKSLTIAFFLHQKQSTQYQPIRFPRQARWTNNENSNQPYLIRSFKSCILREYSSLKFQHSSHQKVVDFKKNLFFDQGDFYVLVTFPQKVVGPYVLEDLRFSTKNSAINIPLNILKFKIFSCIKEMIFVSRKTSQTLNSPLQKFEKITSSQDDWLNQLTFQVPLFDQNFQICLLGLSPIFQKPLSSFFSCEQQTSQNKERTILQSSLSIIGNLFVKYQQILGKTHFLEFDKIQNQRFHFLKAQQMSFQNLEAQNSLIRENIQFEIKKKKIFAQSFENQIFIRFFLPLPVGEVLGNEAFLPNHRNTENSISRHKLERFDKALHLQEPSQYHEILIANFDDFFSYLRTPKISFKDPRPIEKIQKATKTLNQGHLHLLTKILSFSKTAFLTSRRFLSNQTKDQRSIKILTVMDRWCTPTLAMQTQGTLAKFRLGSFYRAGEEFFNHQWMFQTGQLIAQTQQNILFRKAISHLFNHQSVLRAHHGEMISKDQRICTVFYHQSKTGDIVQGIPKIEEIFEARKKSRYSLQELSVFSKDIVYFEKKIQRYLRSLQISVVNNIQRIYCGQGVHISDKHIEIIVRQMTSNVFILDPGQTGLLYGEIVSLQWITRLQHICSTNHVLYEPILMGMTKTCLETSSFLSAASFQETTRILGRAALLYQMDFIRGLKQNIILGNLIPAGTGCFGRFPID